MRHLVVFSLLLGVTIAYKDYINVAEGKNTSQSSVGWEGVSSRAVDGKTDGNWHRASCTHTRNAGVQWWELDLGSVYKIDHILIYGRTDCCSNRLKGAKLWVGNNKCNTLNDMGRNQIETVKCTDPADQVGRRIRIEALNYVTLCEVKVMVESEISLGDTEVATVTSERMEEHGKLVNIAIHKKSYQSSTVHGGSATRGNDGYTNGHYHQGSCTHTWNDGVNYWEVDLGRVYKIDHIMIYGRTDCCSERLNGATVKIGGRTCQILKDMNKDPAKPKKVDCGGDTEKLVGQKVRIEQWAMGITICELQIMANPETLPEKDTVIPTVSYANLGQEIEGYVNVAHNKKTSASSEPWGGVASRAVDGVTNQNWNLKSCTHTNNRGTEWWKIDLGRVYQIDHIRIWGRTDAHQDRLKGARLWIGDHRCGTLKSMGKEAKPDEIRCSEEESRGRFVTIEHHRQFITLCEVQVMVKKGQLDLEPVVVASYGEKMGEFTNVALRRPASQTSEGWNGFAKNGVDGWVMTHYGSGSCTHTHRHGVQSFTVDLGANYKVDHVKFWGRTDCCKERIRSARVFVGRTFCGMLSEDQFKAGQPFVMSCKQEDGSHPTGRHVTISKLNDYLTLCEVQVMVKNTDLVQFVEAPTSFPTWENVAMFKETSQSSEGWGGKSSNAVDGFPTKTMYNAGSCTHTHKNPLSWWKVDLGDNYRINKLKIAGRADCCGDRIDGAVVTMDNKTVGGIAYKSGQTHWEIPLGNMLGRTVRIHLANEYLTLCEVEAWVNHEYDPATDPERVNMELPNLALKATATNSGGSDDAANAVDGDTEGNFYRGSCSSTGPTQGTHWWKVEMAQKHNVGHILIYPRLDQNMANYIDNSEVRLDDASCGHIKWREGAMYYKVDCDGKSGSVVTISRSGGFLQLCEVVVQAAEV